MTSGSEADAAPRSRRVFFALWPDAVVRAAIARAAREPVRLSSGRPVAKDRFHITVAFLGDLTTTGLEVARGVPPIGVGAFDLVLDTVGAFANGGVLWLGPSPSAVPPVLTDLERRLWNELEQHGFIRDERVYQPHVTLARRARALEAQIAEPVPWHVTELALVESLPDGRNVHYEVLETWPL